MITVLSRPYAQLKRGWIELKCYIFPAILPGPQRHGLLQSLFVPLANGAHIVGSLYLLVSEITTV